MPVLDTIVVTCAPPAIRTLLVRQDAPTLATVLIHRGATGAAGEGDTLLGTVIAGQAISGGRCVRLDAADGLLYLADGPAGLPAIGYLRQSVLAGQSAAVYQGGLLTGLGGLTPGAILYLGASGVLTHTAPATGVDQQVGRGFTATSAAMRIHLPILIS